MRMKSIARFRWPKVAAAAAVVVFGLSVFAATAPAALSVTGGTLHARIVNGDGTFVNAPPDQSFVPPSTSITAQTPLRSIYADTTASFMPGQVGITAGTLWVGGASSALASGTLSLVEDTTETISAYLVPGANAPYYFGIVSLDAVGGGGNIFSLNGFGRQFNEPPVSFTATLPPGQYTLSWSDTGTTFLGQSGPGGFDFTMNAAPAPEPGSLTLLGLGGVALMAWRRRERRLNRVHRRYQLLG